jgi:hypothetical protein
VTRPFESSSRRCGRLPCVKLTRNKVLDRRNRDGESAAVKRLGVGVLVVAGAVVASGCGGSAPRRDPAEEARVVSETNAFCRHVSALPAVSRESQPQARAAQARFHALSVALSRTAAYLPAGRDLNEAHVARRALFVEASKHSGLSRPSDFNLRVDRLEPRIYDDELALGVTCADVAVEARRIAHVVEDVPPDGTIVFAPSCAVLRRSPRGLLVP